MSDETQVVSVPCPHGSEAGVLCPRCWSATLCEHGVPQGGSCWSCFSEPLPRPMGPRYRLQVYKGNLVTGWRLYTHDAGIQTSLPDGSQGPSAMLTRVEFAALPWVTLAVVEDKP